MQTLRATGFKNNQQLNRELLELNHLESREFAVVASFEAVGQNGQKYVLSCFIERHDSEYGITGIIDKDKQVDLTALELDLMGKKIQTNLC